MHAADSDTQTELVAEQTATMILADAIIDLATGLAENTDDPRMVDAVVGAVHDAIERASASFVFPGQAPLERADEERALVMARNRARVIAEMIKQACESRLTAKMGPKH